MAPTAAIDAAIAAIAAAQTRSITHITRTCSKRSAITPPYAENTRAGTNRQTVAAAIQLGEPVSSISHTASATL